MKLKLVDIIGKEFVEENNKMNKLRYKNLILIFSL